MMFGHKHMCLYPSLFHDGKLQNFDCPRYEHMRGNRVVGVGAHCMHEPGRVMFEELRSKGIICRQSRELSRAETYTYFQMPFI